MLSPTSITPPGMVQRPADGSCPRCTSSARRSLTTSTPTDGMGNSGYSRGTLAIITRRVIDTLRCSQVTCNDHVEGAIAEKAMRMGSTLRLALSVALAVLALSAILFWLDSPRARAQPLAGITRGYPSVQCATTLQACIDLSANGDSIAIAAGTYITSVTLDKAVSLSG